MSFISPRMLVLLVAIPALVLAYRSMQRARTRRLADLAASGFVSTTAGVRTKRRRHIPFAVFAVGLTVLVVALARPQVDLTIPHREGTVILAFDVSNSMAATDLQPTRMEAAKVAARAFVDEQPESIRVGVVAFGDGAVVVQQPTDARADVVAAIDRLAVAGGTSLGQGLFTALSAIAGKPLSIDEEALSSDAGEVDIGYFGSAVIVVLSDGENTAPPDPVALAEIASVAGVQINTIGLGTPSGTVVDIDGFSVATALNGELLAEVATISDGKYYEAADAKSLSGIYESIDLEFTSRTEHTEVTALFTAAAAGLLMIGALLSVLWLGRVV